MTDQRPDHLTISADQMAGTVYQTDPAPWFALRSDDNQLIMAIHSDGRVEIGDSHTTDQAAAAFWHAVQNLATRYGVEQQFGTHLVDRIEAELKAGREAQRKVERLDQMATAWLEHLPDTISTSTAVEAVHHVTRGDAT